MKKHLFKTMIAACAIAASISFSSCKGKKSDTATTDTVKTDSSATAPAPVVIAPDDQLTTGVKDATKDYPGVTATVNNGEITLTGSITRDKLPNLMMGLNSLHPKKINNNLTISK